MYNSQQIANYFLSMQEEDAGELMSHLKLQKLVYYAQGFHLAIFDKPLFAESIEAWNYGPVVPSLYQIYKTYGNKPIPSPPNIDLSSYTPETQELLDEVNSVFGQFSAWKLRDMTHNEPPWKEAISSRGTITQESMKEYFKTQLNE